MDKALISNLAHDNVGNDEKDLENVKECILRRGLGLRENGDWEKGSRTEETSMRETGGAKEEAWTTMHTGHVTLRACCRE